MTDFRPIDAVIREAEAAWESKHIAPPPYRYTDDNPFIVECPIPECTSWSAIKITLDEHLRQRHHITMAELLALAVEEAHDRERRELQELLEEAG